jgi:hypothetical protein
MADKSPLSVFVAPDVRLASWVVDMLLKWGIPADVKADIPATTVDPLTGATMMADPTGFEVIVTDPAKVDEAKKMLAERIEEMQALEARREARANREGTVTAVCEECGKSSDWPASAMGSTENCPHCTAYMDIPDPEDDWADFDAGADEDEEAK